MEETEDTLRDVRKMAGTPLNKMSDRSSRTLPKLNGPRAAGFCVSGDRKTKQDKDRREWTFYI